jgi:Na+(H+)/acetate symporter ActP
MSLTDWIVLGVTLLAIVMYGVWKSGKSQNIDQFLVGGRSMPWYTVGLSVMATQATGPSLLGRDAVCTILFWPSAGYDRALYHLRAYIQPTESLHRL